MLKFYRCNTCGNLIEIIEESGVTPICCGKLMAYLCPATTDAAMEKHVPVYTRTATSSADCQEASDNPCTLTVKIGEMPHPMTDDHYIHWIVLHTDRGIYRKVLSPSAAPETEFYLREDEKLIAVYAYCNKHGLWVRYVT